MTRDEAEQLSREAKPCPFMIDGHAVLIDDCDRHLLAESSWYVKKCGGKNRIRYYVAQSSGGKELYLHHVICQKVPGLEIDHRNGNSLDNRRENLRNVTHSQNILNATTRPGKSGFRGVWKGHRSPGWVAMGKRDGKRYSFGTHATPELAYQAYLAGMAKLFQHLPEPPEAEND